ncbi:MAG: type II toxin-antitoxin system prevent-host-death family antitoxin [Chloroflexota bacterium]|nr:type II toxin-antitoxin system prevent-host-death family antitoxin [Chloroflexota bacterium]
MMTVDIDELRAHLDRLVADATRGERITITDHGRIVAAAPAAGVELVR